MEKTSESSFLPILGVTPSIRQASWVEDPGTAVTSCAFVSVSEPMATGASAWPPKLSP